MWLVLYKCNCLLCGWYYISVIVCYVVGIGYVVVVLYKCNCLLCGWYYISVIVCYVVGII